LSGGGNFRIVPDFSDHGNLYHLLEQRIFRAMLKSFLSLISNIALLALALIGLFFITHRTIPSDEQRVPQSILNTETAAVLIPVRVSTSSLIATSTKRIQSATTTKRAVKSKKRLTTDPNEITRIRNPYEFPPQSFLTINELTRAALVNILCMPQSGSFKPVSGSGVIIDPRGVILTNAHVAQYVLLSQSQRVNVICTIRSGSPAVALWKAEVLYIPPIWVKEHVDEINTEHPLGTGEHDYALLRITSPLDTVSPPPTLQGSGFPAISVDTREAIGFESDSVLAASYPAEFVGGIVAQLNLFAVSSVVTIKQLLTFRAQTVDLLSLGGVLEAQGGSSGGAVVNAWGRLIGIITTTSEGTTTAARDLRAITLSYVNRDLMAQTQSDLPTILGGDIAAEALDFNTHVSPELVKLYVDKISR
jgi:S1-C subfamily serine protease